MCLHASHTDCHSATQARTRTHTRLTYYLPPTNRYQALAEEHAELQERWEKRGPRDEDVALIQQLQGKNDELEELVSELGMDTGRACRRGQDLDSNCVICV